MTTRREGWKRRRLESPSTTATPRGPSFFGDRQPPPPVHTGWRMTHTPCSILFHAQEREYLSRPSIPFQVEITIDLERDLQPVGSTGESPPTVTPYQELPLEQPSPTSSTSHNISHPPQCQSSSEGQRAETPAQWLLQSTVSPTAPAQDADAQPLHYDLFSFRCAQCCTSPSPTQGPD
jgi:hypothetical protein